MEMQKKYLLWLIVAILATISFSLTSCGSDDDEPSTKEYDGTLYGEWVSTSGNYSKDYIYFSSSGHGEKGTYDASIDMVSDEEDFTWYTVNDKKLYIDGKAYDYWCDGTELEIHWKKKTITYREK